MGRPSKYKAEYAEQSYKLCLLGATDKQMADFFEVDEATINRWKESHSEFCESLKKGKSIADANVAEKLYTRATGYEYTEETYESTELKNGDNVIPAFLVKRTIKQMAPDTTAGIFWLKNRQPQAWRDKHDMEHSGKMDLDVDIERMDDHEILDGVKETLQAINALQKRIGT